MPKFISRLDLHSNIKAQYSIVSQLFGGNSRSFKKWSKGFEQEKLDMTVHQMKNAVILNHHCRLLFSLLLHYTLVSIDMYVGSRFEK